MISFTFDGLQLLGAISVVVPVFLAILEAEVKSQRTELSQVLVDKMPVPVQVVPYFCLMWILTTWFLMVLVFVMGIASTRPAGYDNKSPRNMAKDKSLGWLYRIHCAEDNTTEFLGCFTLSLFVTDKLALNPLLVAKWSVLVILSRTVYPFCYAFNVDALRTSVFAVGFFASFVMGWTAIFPDSMLPYCVAE